MTGWGLGVGKILGSDADNAVEESGPLVVVPALEEMGKMF